jgi:hypothetical protein
LEWDVVTKYERFKARKSERYRERKARGLCGVCGKRPLHTASMCTVCYGKHLVWKSRRKKEFDAKKLCVDCGKARKGATGFCSSCTKRRSGYTKVKKDVVYMAYGGYRCVCCGETDPAFLTLDHVNNDGTPHRRRVGAGYALYQWLIKNNFPPVVQVMCMNCNWSKRSGVCVHKEQERRIISTLASVPLTY